MGRSLIKDGGLIRELSSNSEPKVYPCTVSPQPRPLREGALTSHWSAANCTVYYRTGGVTGNIVYKFYFLAIR